MIEGSITLEALLRFNHPLELDDLFVSFCIDCNSI